MPMNTPGNGVWLPSFPPCWAAVSAVHTAALKIFDWPVAMPGASLHFRAGQPGWLNLGMPKLAEEKGVWHNLCPL
jgi:hypothetical protein